MKQIMSLLAAKTSVHGQLGNEIRVLNDRTENSHAHMSLSSGLLFFIIIY